MNPISHLLTGWVVANTADLTTRDRVVVTLAGVAPDIDGLGVVAEILTENTTSPLLWYSKYHQDKKCSHPPSDAKQDGSHRKQQAKS